MSEYVVVIDAGKWLTKVIGRDIEGTIDDVKKISFRTKEYDLSEGDIELQGNSYKVEFDGLKSILGEQGKSTTENSDTTKTSPIHRLSAYTAITQYLEPNEGGKQKDNKISLVLACPLTVLKSIDMKEEYKQYIKGDGVITLVVNGEEYSFEIVDVTIKAEGSGILYLKEELFENKQIMLIDLGGLNMGVSIYRNGVCNPDDRFLAEHGAKALILKISDILSTKYNKGNFVDLTRAEQALEDGFLKKNSVLDKLSVPFITEAKEWYYKKAIAIIKEHGYDMADYDPIFVGGTTVRLEEQIKDMTPHSYIAPDSQWTTCEGLYRVAQSKYGKKVKKAK